MQTAKELFIHELADMLDAEQRLLKALQEQVQLASNEQLSRAFEAHRTQTENQVERLRQVFEELGEEPEKTECHGMVGLIEEVQSFKKEDPSPDILDHFMVGAAEKVESYEIRGYEGLVEMAEEFGMTKAVRLLNQSLREEQATLKKMQAFAKKIKPQDPGLSDEEKERLQRNRSRSNGSRRTNARSKKSSSSNRSGSRSRRAA